MLEWGGCGPVSTLLPLSFSSEPVGPTDTVADEGCCCCWLESLQGYPGGGRGGGGGGGWGRSKDNGRRRVHSVGHWSLLGCLGGGTHSGVK